MHCVQRPCRLLQETLLCESWFVCGRQVPGGNAFYAWKGRAKYAGSEGICLGGVCPSGGGKDEL